MKILHYALGFPPYRTGGLTKYCVDLMIGQKEKGYEVALLWPGEMGVINHKLSIRNNKAVDGIQSFEIVNPLPVALDEGIIEVSAFTKSCDKEVYKKFIERYKPDVVHLHTLMGLHKEFLQITNELGIKTVFTTHDYYGICPKVTLFSNGHTCDDDRGCRKCVECNQTALSLRKIKLIQSPLYRWLKDSTAVKVLRRRHRREFFDEKVVKNAKFLMSETQVKRKAEEYQFLRKYYIDMYTLVNTMHFNSTVTKMIYYRYFQHKESQVISITHRNINDHRKKKYFDEKLKITYLAPDKPFKGFDVLKKALDELWEEGYKNFQLNIFCLTKKTSPYMNIQDRYEYSDLERIFNKTDMLVAPSIWYETFGFTVLEALSYGVPTLISQNVGAKDLIAEDKGIIIKDDYNELKSSILAVYNNRNILKTYNLNIINSKNLIPSSDNILTLYKR